MAKIEVVKQHDLKDCGACSLQSIIKYYDGYIPIEKIRDDTKTNNVGTTAYDLMEAARSYGFDTMGIKVDDIKNENIYYPNIAHVVLENGLNHFVVIYKVTKNYIWIMDPAVGKVKKKIDDFYKIWDNVLILLTPIDKILKFDKGLTISSLLWKLIVKNKIIFFKICLINIIVMIFTILSSFYLQVIVSSINIGDDIGILQVIMFFFALTFFFKVFLNFIKNYYLVYFYRNLDVELFTNFLEHIFNLPLKFMQNRSTGEIVSRVQDLNEIKDLLAEFFTNVLLNTVLIMGSVMVLYSISSKLCFILCLVITIYVIIGLLFSKLIYIKVKDNINAVTNFNSTLVENIESNISIKNLGLSNSFLKYLEEKLIVMFRSNFKTQAILNNISLIKDVIYEIGIFIVISMGVLMIYKGQLDVLALITFHSLIFYLFNPVQDFINLLPKFNYLKASFSKLSEFINIKEEINEVGIKEVENNSIEFLDVSFGYNKTLILSHVSFTIEPGEKVFLKGHSGCGKSTICNLLQFPRSLSNGMIKIGGINVADYSWSTIQDIILYVGQNEKLITGTIEENIRCFRNVSDNEYKQVIDICRIEGIVQNKLNRYNSMINALQNNLSGGELQRIILARALLKKAKILILDEALSEVNYDLELEILDDIKKYYANCTLIYVSHKDVSAKFTNVLDMEKFNEYAVSK